MLTKHYFTFTLVFLFCVVHLQAQISYTAKDKVPPFKGSFGFGSNMGHFPHWTDEELANIAIGNSKLGIEGAGVRTLRPALFEHFLETHGYDSRIETFQHYQQLGAEHLTAFIGFPSEAHRENKNHCPNKPSQVFANLYTDIWDNGENGTPINDENFYALYLYKMVSRYKDYITFWEIWNEPDFTDANNAWKTTDLKGNWWTQNPPPCESKLNAPVFHYIRMLRISYEVIKTLDPESFIAVGGLGYPSYLDAIMRNSDNPKDGSISSEYPHRGGAYFDVMSFHTYPHIDGSLQHWDTQKKSTQYQRNSEVAVQGVIQKKKEFEAVLKKYKYSFQFPQKHFIITECNIPRKQYGQFIGSKTAQKNFLIKTFIELQKEKVIQCYVYDLADNQKENNAKNEFDLMGLYKNLDQQAPIKNTLAIAFKTTADLLHGYQIDFVKTQELQFPDGVNGAAFKHPLSDSSIYVLWAIPNQDQSEEASQFYTFPYAFNAASITIKKWDYSRSKEISPIASTSIHLTSSPVFIELKEKEINPKIPLLEIFPNPFDDLTYLKLNLEKQKEVTLAIYDLNGSLIHSFHQKEQKLPGQHRYQFRPEDPSAVYICKLMIDEKTHLFKLVKVR